MKDRHPEWGWNIRNAREAKGLTQVKLADLTGVRQPTLARWELGTLNPNKDDRLAVAKALEMDVSALYPTV